MWCCCCWLLQVQAALPHSARGVLPLKLTDLIAATPAEDRVLIAQPVKGWRTAAELFSASELTRWQIKPEQQIWLDYCQAATVAVLEQRVRAWLQQQQFSAALQIKRLTLAPGATLPCADWGLQGSLRLGKGQVLARQLTIVSGRGGLPLPFVLEADYQLWFSPVELAAAQTLTLPALQAEWRALEQLSPSMLWLPQASQEYLARQPIRAGQAILPSQVQLSPAVLAGQRVELQLLLKAVQIVSQARALENGEPGQWIQVLPATATQAVKARVIAKGKVQIDD